MTGVRSCYLVLRLGVDAHHAEWPLAISWRLGFSGMVSIFKYCRTKSESSLF